MQLDSFAPAHSASGSPIYVAPFPAGSVQCVCHGTLPWLISVSLDSMRTIRPIASSDVPETFRVRTATDENRLTSAQLTALGITENSVSEKLRGSCKGWLCEEQGSVVGFA